MTKRFAFQFGFIHVLLYVCFRIFYVCFTNYALCMIKLFMFYTLWLFLMLPKGERKMGILEIKILYFQSFKIKHKFKMKGGERDD